MWFQEAFWGLQESLQVKFQEVSMSFKWLQEEGLQGFMGGLLQAPFQNRSKTFMKQSWTTLKHSQKAQ